MNRCLCITLWAILLTSCSSQPDTFDAPFIPVSSTVYRIIDGDTIEVLLKDGTEETVRIIGIDTPEYEECYFNEAATYLRKLISDAEIVLQQQPGDDRDKYSRLLRYVHLDGIDIGLQLIRDGYAKNYPWFEHPRLEEYKAAESEAQRSNRGLWAECDS
jgi:micrococcal nuclease